MNGISGFRAGDLVRVPNIQGALRVVRVDHGVVTARTDDGRRVHVGEHAVSFAVDFYA